MFYKIVQADNLARLAQLVTDLLHQGWAVSGGVCFDGAQYLQAMIRA